MAISDKKTAKYENAFNAIIQNDLKELIKLVNSMLVLKYNEKCPVEDSPFYRCSLLHAAATHGSPETVTFLLNKGFNVNFKNDAGQTPMHYAIVFRKKNICDILQILLQANGARINIKDSDGDSLLHYAVSRDLKVVEYLVKNKANVNAVNCWGETPLHTAAEKADLPVMQYLLTHKADIEIKDSFGGTPLRSALNGRDPEKAINLLIKAGANTSDQDLDGNTTLHAAVIAGETDIAKILVSAGADRSVLNNAGQTAADLCMDKKLIEKLTPPKKKTRTRIVKDLSLPASLNKDIVKIEKKDTAIEKRHRRKRTLHISNVVSV